MSNTVFTYWEHCGYKPEKSILLKEEQSRLLSRDFYEKTFSKTHRGRDASQTCFRIFRKEDETTHQIYTSYFIGVDWIEKEKTALYVAPKLNSDAAEVDFIKMLFSSLRHPEVAKEINELFEVKWDEPAIKINQQQDLLTPFLVVEFLSLLKTIVLKGLKKSYYKVEKNLQSKVKGKVLVGKSIKHNLMQNKNLYTYCSYDEFGLDNKENRLLKKALVFVKRYLPVYTELTDHKNLKDTFNYITPAFHSVSEKIELNEIKQTKENAFYKEYTQAIYLAKMILKRFGYNISNTVKETVETPPFWIDMSKLFELYVLGLMKDRFHHEVEFQLNSGRGNELDFLLKEPGLETVIDTKYKAYWKWNPDHKDVRQVSGYTRLKDIYSKLDIPMDQIIDGMVIYPDLEEGEDDFSDDKLKDNRRELKEYNRVYSIGVKLPLVKN